MTIVINIMGFSSGAMYLRLGFFKTEPVHLIGEGLLPELLNDNRLGRRLDTLYDCDVAEVLARVAQRTFDTL